MIDEFHEFYNIIESVYSDIQNLLRIDAGEICEEEKILCIFANPVEYNKFWMKVSIDYKNSFEDIYVAFYSRMKRFAQSYLIYEEEAENIVQDIFIDIWEKKIDFSAISNVSGYLFLLLKNRCIDNIRRNKVEAKALTEIQKENEISFKLKLDSLQALDDKFLTDPDIDKLIDQAINKLPEKCRQIFVMNRFEGKKQRDIAAELDISINTVESQMSIAYKKLKEELKEFFHVFIFFF